MGGTPEAAGIRMATLQCCFPSREDLFSGAFEDIADKAWTKMMAGIDQRLGVGDSQKLRYTHGGSAQQKNFMKTEVTR
jgi:hypothetical protein